MIKLNELLKELSLEFGPSGYEDMVKAKIREKISHCVDENSELYEDKVGNLIYHIKGEGKPKLMINAHMDEVGLMVTQITDKGEAFFGSVGGIDPIVLSGKRVISENGILGTIMTKPVHLLTSEEREKVCPISEMVIDIGARDKQDCEKYVNVGDYFVFLVDYMELGKDLICGKALDDRLGCAIMVRLICQLYEDKKELDYDLYFAFTGREEISYSTAFGATENIKPDYAIVLESKAVADLPSVAEEKKVSILGDGGIVSFADKGAIYDRGLTDHIINLCKKADIKYQVNKFVSGGNDSANIQKSIGGVKVAVISAGSRYIHSSSNVISRADFESIYKATYEVITNDRIN